MVILNSSIFTDDISDKLIGALSNLDKNFESDFPAGEFFGIFPKSGIAAHQEKKPTVPVNASKALQTWSDSLDLPKKEVYEPKWRGSQTGIRYPDFESCECGAHATQNPDLHSEWCPKHAGVKRD